MPFTAIFGGTFNPFHIGHLKMLKALDDAPFIEEIFVMPDKIPPHKSAQALAEDEIRIECCRLCLKNIKKARLCLIEFEREGKSYTYDTLLKLKEKYPNKNFCFVMGGDMLVYFDKWYRNEELIKMLSFIVFKRADTDITEFNNCIEKFRKKGMEIILFDDIIPNVSSTEIRNDFSKAKELLPREVFEYLKEKGVYGGKLR